ncbi:hypothetical protein [Clostridium disporicum]|uniref:hypothetical protein n=1 Tax=Clostridium disporicum TaxID=84024 RepID=UPI003620D3FC
MLYEDGIGIERNYNEAVKFYNRAISGYYRYSNQGDPISKQRLGTMYYNGKGIKKRY